MNEVESIGCWEGANSPPPPQQAQTLTLPCSDTFRCRLALIYDTPYHSTGNTNSLALRSRWQISHSVWSATRWDASSCPPTSTVWSPTPDRHDCRNMEMARPRANSCAQWDDSNGKEKENLALNKNFRWRLARNTFEMRQLVPIFFGKLRAIHVGRVSTENGWKSVNSINIMLWSLDIHLRSDNMQYAPSFWIDKQPRFSYVPFEFLQIRRILHPFVPWDFRVIHQQLMASINHND